MVPTRRARRLWLPMLFLLAFAALPALAADYRVGPEDTLTVTVVDHPELGGTVVVAADGSIQVPVIGPVGVAGKTLPEITDLLTKGFLKRLKAPEVYVILTARNPQVYALGSVARPGAYPLTQNHTALQLLVSAGSLAQPAEISTARILRRDGKQEPVALADLVAGKPEANLPLLEGDVLIVEAQPAVPVYVAGEVTAPGVYQVPQGSKLSLALGMARGLARNAADLRGSILRKGAIIPVDLTQVYAAGGAGDVALQAGDVVRIDSTLIAVTVAGDVKAPGTFAAPAGIGAVEAVNLAGGVTPSGQPAAVMLTHRDGTSEAVDLTKAGKVVLRDGDRLFVPTAVVQVAVSGEVKAPGAYTMAPSMRAIDVLALAGGPTPVAALAAVKVLRANGTVEVIDANTAKLALQSGDRLYVPTNFVAVTVAGDVKAPGTYQMAPGMTLVDAVAMAGGATTAGNLKSVQVMHAGGATETVDLTAAKPALRDGDRLVVPTQFISIFVAGEVRTPGTFQVSGALRVRDALALAGGATLGAALDKVQVLHLGGTSDVVNADGPLALRDGDRVLVPSSLISVSIAGEVKAPGAYQIAPGMLPWDAIALAGGLTPAAQTKGAQLWHVGGKGETIDLQAAKAGLQDGDRIVVPSRLIRVNVAGEVAAPGAYPVAATATVADVIAQAGGLTAAASDRASLAHLGGATETVATDAATVLQDGDRVLVRSALVTVDVAGEVKLPGAIRVRPTTKLADVLALAGGPTAAAALGAIRVAHANGTLETVASGANMTFQDGDRIAVTCAMITVTVGGEVKSPGVYHLAPDTRLADAVALAGGTAPSAATTAVQVAHLRGGVETVDLAATRLTLQDGDRIQVPSNLITVTVGGEVKAPGAYPLAPNATAAAAIAAAGGPNAAGAKGRVQVLHVGGLLELVDQPAATALKDGDRVTVLSALIGVTVAGEVKTPGAFAMTAGSSLADALAIAGGPTPAASLRAVKIARAGGAVETADATAGAVALRDGDRVIVPTWLMSVVVTGEVKTPGAYQMAPGMTVADALAQAGGLTMNASLDRVQVLHLGGASEMIGPDGGKLALKDGDRVLVATATVSVAVTGEVKAPGLYQLSPQMAVADALQAAGGPTAVAALDRVRVLHLGGGADVVSVADAKLLLKDGDRIAVPSSLVNVSVGGEVVKPGSYQVSALMSVADVIAAAGGAAKNAGLGKVQVVHAGGAVDVVDATRTGDGVPAGLRDGDRVIVPTADGMVSVWGFVKTPGLFPVDTARPLTISEAILRASGIPDNSATRITLTRQTEGTPISFTYKVGDVMNHLDPKADQPLRPGDVVFVERKKSGGNWQKTLQTTLSVLSLFTLARNL